MKTTLLILIALLGFSMAAQAEPPAFGQRNRIKNLAYELAEAAHHAHQYAEHRAGFRRNTRTLEALHNLDRQARLFNRTVRRRAWSHPRTEQAYWDLVRTYRQARRLMRRTHTSQVVFQDMRRMGRLLNQMAHLDDGYGRYNASRPTWQNDYDQGDDYDDGYYDDDRYRGKKSQRQPVKPPRRGTVRH